MSPEDLGLADLDIPGLYFQISSWVLRYRRPSSVRYTTWWCPKCDNINVAFCSTDLEMESSCVIFCPSPRENGHGTHSILPVWVYQRSTYSSAASHLAIASRLMSSSIVQHQHLPKQYHLGPTVDIALWKKIHVDEFNSCEVRASDYSASRMHQATWSYKRWRAECIVILGSVLSLMERPNVKALGRLQVGPTRPPCS